MNDKQVVETRDLEKVAGGRQILKGVNLHATPGSVVGLLGKNGAGKSTLLDVLLGFALPTAGEARVFGEASSRLSAACKARIGFVPQQDELMSLMTGAQRLISDRTCCAASSSSPGTTPARSSPSTSPAARKPSQS